MTPRKHFTPRPYQQLITNHILTHERCAIWAGMGMGKTSGTLNAIDALLLAEDDPVLVVAPLRVARTTWPDEVRKWEHLRGINVVPIVGGQAERLLALRTPAQVYTINYENLPWLVEHWGDRWPYRTVVLDEATKVKGFRLKQGTQRAKALAQVAHTHVRRLVQLTGTPSPNGLQDLWGQAWFIDRGQRLGRTYTAFSQRWFQASHDGYGSTPLAHAQKEIQDLMRDVCLTVDAKDWFDLREPIVNTIHVDLPMQARKHYREMEKAMFTEIESHQVEAFNAAARTIKCLQIANGAAYVGEGSEDWKELHDAKLQALDSIIEEAGGAPVLVAYHFKSDLARLQRAYPDGIHLSSHAGLRAAQAGKGRVWFGHPASMGHGVDGLQQHCNILAFFGHWWTLEDRLQMIERIGPTRQMQAGHDRPVFIHNIVARDTVDELVMARIETKREVQDLLLEAMKTRRAS
ncbi:DEAD/DEAH box helicase [Paracidovorax citrulli]|uniref:DEAD/DEAH box helicase n=1 Tax=Paracidovorax citrulli TaxID=80869 RepID=UPI0005FAD17E|nr:DEAD/DEAH box helicase [Paracidovorax citrulli]UMT88348.1 DEAD/DEAH box helicase [Paracidovorax citrulli]WIY32745.1 DEAD/DEAH box helicase [Paracidovorax citrulli]SDJ32500.1 SNF2 family N-terminal domain-containing protein [Paracidovorax citrulli]